MLKGPQGHLRVFAHLAVQIGAFVVALTGLVALLIFHRFPPWVWHAWEGTLVTLAVASLALYVFVGRRNDLDPRVQQESGGKDPATG